VIGATVDFFRKVKNAATIEKLRERAREDGSPRGYVELCRALVLQGSPARALSVAQEGVRCFPRSLELADQLRLIWNTTGRDELNELVRAANATQSADSYRALAEHYLDVEELDLALSTAEKLVEQHASAADGPCLAGRALWKRFARDHVATDGRRALEFLRRAIALDPKCFEALFLLAELCFYVGSVTDALHAAAGALAAKPSDRAAAALHTLLLGFAPGNQTEEELLRAVEDSEGPWRGYRPPGSRDQASESPARSHISRMLHQISLMTGVRGLAFSNSAVELVGRDGNVFEEKRAQRDTMADLTSVFRNRIAASSKRLGIGALQEAEVTLSGSSVFAFAGTTSVLLVEVDPAARTAQVVPSCRDAIGSLDRSPEGSSHD
jgi:tetratricopeptide (TPR) repeat protein